MLAAYTRNNVASIPFSRTSTRRPPPFKAAIEEELRETVYVVDRDGGIRNQLSDALAAVNLKAFGFATASDYLAFIRKDSAACLILDTHLPDMSGLDLQRQLVDKANPPVIFMSGVCDIAATVSAMKAGAIEFLTKPLDLGALVVAVRAAFVQDRRIRQRKADVARLLLRYSLLTRREREVLPLVVGGLLNKQAASMLGISEVTLQIHRSQVMRKMEAESFADLVRMAVKLRIPHRGEFIQAAGLPMTNEASHCDRLGARPVSAIAAA